MFLIINFGNGNIAEEKLRMSGLNNLSAEKTSCAFFDRSRFKLTFSVGKSSYLFI